MADLFITLPKAPWQVLRPGIHRMSIAEFERTFAINPPRRKQFNGLIKALIALKYAGCMKVYIDGSYVTKKPVPGDFDACWEVLGVEEKKLDPVFKDFSNGRANQKKKYEGEFFPAHALADGKNNFIKFFQIEKFTGQAKGIVLLELSGEKLENFGEAS